MDHAIRLPDVEPIVDKLIEDNPDKVARVRNNHVQIGWFVAKVMQQTGGTANPVYTLYLLEQRILQRTAE